MADEMTTPGTSVENTTPPTGAQLGETTPPIAEQQNAFQHFLSTLFGGGKPEAAAEEPLVDSAPAKEQAPATAYTETDLQSKLQEARAVWDAEQKEQTRLSKLPPEERSKAEADARDKRVQELETKLLQRDLKDTALTALQQDGYPVGLAELLNYSGQAEMEKSLQHTQNVFRAALETAVKERLRGKTPEGLGGGAKVENLLRDQIAKNVRGGLM